MTTNCINELRGIRTIKIKKVLLKINYTLHLKSIEMIFDINWNENRNIKDNKKKKLGIELYKFSKFNFSSYLIHFH